MPAQPARAVWAALADVLPLTVLTEVTTTSPAPGVDMGSTALRTLLDAARAAGLRPPQYADLLMSYYQALAFEHAGIDPATWQPDLGADANRDTVYLVYRYYGQLFLDHPELQWAGMANMIGPSFAAGFRDLASVRDFARRLEHMPGDVSERIGLRGLAKASDAELSFFETTFLQMQQNIFLDQAPMHEAYLAGGVPALRDMHDAGLINQKVLQAWTDIGQGSRTGDAPLVAAGNAGLLYQEQMRIIADDYDHMRDHDGPVGQGFTYAMTVLGTPSIPGAHAFGEVYPLHVRIASPGPERLGIPGPLSVDNPLQVDVDVTTPLPDGNISQRDERWKLIVNDTLPAYQRLLEDDPERVRQIVASPIETRVDAYRLEHQIDDILKRLSHWSVHVHE
jgi:hypothetical protein